MTEGRPQTWHYGLVARWWAEVNPTEPEELAYYAAAIRRFGEPALDLGCGVGRLLVPLLADGLDVDGLDISPDMLDLARRAARAAGIDPGGRFVEQAFHELDLPRRYRTIYCCDSFGIGATREQDAEALRRVHDQLEPGGAFVMSHEPATPGAAAADDRPLPRPWPEAAARAMLFDGDELELLTRLAARDSELGRETLDMRARLWHRGRLLAEEDGRIQLMQYTIDDVREMLHGAGFVNIEVQDRYDGAPATPGAETVVFVARRP
jgi:SAM-dependent methyltransferase